MSSFIIEEVDSNDVPEEMLSEFVEAEEIPIVATELQDDDNDSEDLPSDFDFSENEEADKFEINKDDQMDDTTPSTSTAKTSTSKSKSKKPSVASEKFQSMLLKKFMNNEIR